MAKGGYVLKETAPMKTFLVRFKGHDIQHVRAASCELQGDSLVFLTPKHQLVAIFLFEHVDSVSVIAY
jgi:hypothetical protein